LGRSRTKQEMEESKEEEAAAEGEQERVPEAGEDREAATEGAYRRREDKGFAGAAGERVPIEDWTRRSNSTRHALKNRLLA